MARKQNGGGAPVNARKDEGMRTISVINLKGGVGKTTTVLEMAMELAHRHGKRVLIVDNDVQANVTRYFDLLNYDRPAIEDIYRNVSADMGEIIQATYANGALCREYVLDVVPSNMNLDAAITDLMKDEGQDQIHKLQDALTQVSDLYDYCIIDNPPGIGMNVINALACTQDVIIPIKIDKAAMDGMEELNDLITEVAAFNDKIQLIKCLVTLFYKSPETIAAEMILRKSDYDIFQTNIRYSRKVDAGSFEKNGKWLMSYSPRSSACIDYRRFVDEYIAETGGDRDAENTIVSAHE